jgi:hypothetical protein
LIINLENVAAKTTQLRPASRLRRDRHPAVRLGGSELEEAGLVGALAHVSVEESVWERSGQGYRTIFP